MSTSVTWIIPVQIDLRATPNRSGGSPGLRKRLKDELMNTTWLATLGANVGDATLPMTLPLVLDVRVARGRGRKPMDDDNVIAWAKPMRDAIAATIGLNDTHIITGMITQDRDPHGVGFVEATLREQRSDIASPAP